jgi:hypothetical protein
MSGFTSRTLFTRIAVCALLNCLATFCYGALPGHDYDRMHGPPTPESFRNLVAAPAFLVMIGPSATVFYKQLFSYDGLLLVQCQLGL